MQRGARATFERSGKVCKADSNFSRAWRFCVDVRMVGCTWCLTAFDSLNCQQPLVVKFEVRSDKLIVKASITHDDIGASPKEAVEETSDKQ